ncbi:DeoR/GlpR transcriptional regulator [Phyllobacterium sp. 628]|uniref:DeoR/GlpR family DNA-binding transcription regulator n=1 Tax=Phyllobacterium sp. 628 TaxID=2718938 RepID=UPI0016624895|nr:DeoR/GlpR family DNA-binding transcription regulator [Phyllobacterium sp. 628]QND53719.1 DeoR/GlpR transcriptional regulator [Phyllobacterium sp. 628]
MLTQQRKAHILHVLKQTGQVIAKQLSQELDLSEDTIRRDLRELAADGLLQRVHGGALPASPALADFSGRQTIATDGKQAIGRAAAAMIRPNQVIFIDGGTTAVQLARQLPPDLVATIVTHSPSVAVELVNYPNITVDLIGGRLFKHSVVAVGASAIEAIGRYRADIYFMGATGIHPEIGLTTGDSEEAAVKRMLCHHAAETVVLASREKLGAASPYLVVSMNDVQCLVVERDTPQESLQAYTEMDLTIIKA